MIIWTIFHKFSLNIRENKIKAEKHRLPALYAT